MVLHVVVARYEEDLDWIASDLVPLCSPRPSRVVVYNKGSSAVDVESNVEVIPLPNVGREAHTYLHHIIATYHANNDDVTTLFLPGSCRALPHKWKSVREVVARLGRSVFPCIKPPRALDAFSLNAYSSSHPGNAKKNPELRLEPSPIRPYGRWCREVLGARTTDCMTYWGIFAVSQRDVRRRPPETYAALISFVDYHPNHEAAHYLERAWPIVFHQKVENKRAVVLALCVLVIVLVLVTACPFPKTKN